MKENYSYFYEDTPYEEVLITMLSVAQTIKDQTILLYKILPCPDGCNDPNVIFDLLDSEQQKLYEGLDILIKKFDCRCYICSANHIFGHYLKSICLTEAGIELIKSLRAVWCYSPNDINALLLLLRSEMELIVFILRYMENAVREYQCC